MAETLWAGLYCPGLPLKAVWQGVQPETPVAVHDGSLRIVQADAPARRLGVRRGQRLGSALALVPELDSRPRDLRAEQRLLENMALTAYRFSHQVALAPPATVLAELGGSRRLHGGLKPLIAGLDDDFQAQGLGIRIGLAPAPAAACLLARHAIRVASLKMLRHSLAGLPVDALMLEPGVTRQLAGCGLKTIGALMKVDAGERARRFGPGLNRHLDQIHGHQPTPLAQWQPPERFARRLEMPVASDRAEALLFACQRLLKPLQTWLEVRDRALVAVRIGLCLEQGGKLDCRIGLARPARDRQRLKELIRLKFDAINLPGPVSALDLRAVTTDQHRPTQQDLLDGTRHGDQWPALIDRLGARLKPEHIVGLAPGADHRPERAWCWVRPGTTRPCSDQRPRPNWLLPAPQPCRRAGLDLEEGPERIECGWWDGNECRRDYWVARDRHGRRLWVFREYQPRSGWFIHGYFG